MKTRILYKMCRYRQRRKLTKTHVFVPMLLLLLLHLLQLATATSMDATTEYSPLSKTTAGTGRSVKAKLLPSSTLAKAQAAAAAHAEQEERDTHQTLVVQSSKSYISGPTTQAPKLLKRAGIAAGSKQKPKIKQNRNRTREAENSKKQPNEASDHIPDSSGHIPYRIGRPSLPRSEYDTDTGAISSDSGAYQPTGPYDGDEKWQHEYWNQDYNKELGYNSTRVQHIEAECQDDYMKIRIGFNGSFSGLLYSAGYAYDPDCMYINGSGRDYYEFYIQLNRCGTLGKNALHDEKRKNPTNFMWNTVTVQYNPLIEEEYDEHFKVTCEYGYDFWKTVTFPFLDVEVATGNPVVFTLSPPECYMEIQNGYGIGGPRVTGPVRVGDPLTLIIYMRSKYDGFDIVVNDCYAHNGANKRIQLIDDFGCPVDDKLISRFRGSWSDAGVFETQVYAYMKTFRFTGSPALYIECDVRMCHGRCPSQPCHWRNLKAVTKRDISNATGTTKTTGSSVPTNAATAVNEKPEVSLSENVSLFQALRVLQEGESDADEVYLKARRLQPSLHQTCLKTTTFSALTVTFSLLVCALSGALMLACSRLKQRSKSASLYDTYITHKEQID